MAPPYTTETTGEEVANDWHHNIHGKTVIVTGVSPTGIGAEVARVVALHDPGLLILAGRTREKTTEVKNELLKSSPKVAIRVLVVDLASFLSVREAANEVKTWTNDSGISAIINNAGVMAVPEYTKTEDGVELTMQANYVGHWLFSNLLMSEVIKMKGAVVNVTSDSHSSVPGIDTEDFAYKNGTSYHKWAAYAHSKAAMIMFSLNLAKKVKALGARTFSVDPGVVLGTGLVRSVPVEDFKAMGWVNEDGSLNTAAFTPVSAGQAAAGMLIGAFDTSISDQSGSMIIKSQVDDTAIAPWAKDPMTAEKLWKTSERITGQEFTY